MKEVEALKVLKDRFEANPLLEQFYKADKSVPVDEMITYEEWKPLALQKDPLAKDEDLEKYFQRTVGLDGEATVLDFEEYRVAMNIVEAQKELRERFNQNERLEEFYNADSSSPKDEKLTFEEWLPLAMNEDAT